jgi:hypothetical protein
MSNPKLGTAAKDCKAYRKYLKEKGIPQYLASKGFLITREMIDRLLAQNNGNIDGIRIYVGLDESTPAGVIKPYAVGCVKNGEQYNDYKVPARNPQAAVDPSMAATTTPLSEATDTTLTATSVSTEPVVEEPRPCPSYCSQENELNTDE